MKSDLKPKVSIYGFFTHEITLARDIALSVVIIIFYPFPIIQILSVFLLVFCLMIFKAVTRPLESRLDNIHSIINELLYSVIIAIYFSFSIMKVEDLGELVLDLVVYFTLSLIGVLIVLNVGVALYASIQIAIKGVKRCNRKARESEKVEDLSPKKHLKTEGDKNSLPRKNLRANNQNQKK